MLRQGLDSTESVQRLDILYVPHKISQTASKTVSQTVLASIDGTDLVFKECSDYKNGSALVVKNRSHTIE
jgi:hypothetical protein